MVPQLTSLYLDQVDELILPLLIRCGKLLLLDLPLEPFATAFHRSVGSSSHAARVLSDSHHVLIPPGLRGLRLHRVTDSPECVLGPHVIEKGIDEVEKIVTA